MFYDIKYIVRFQSIHEKTASMFHSSLQRLCSNIGVTVPVISKSSKQIKHFERSYVLGNLAGLLVTGTLIL